MTLSQAEVEEAINSLKRKIEDLHEALQKICPHKDTYLSNYTNGCNIRTCRICGRWWEIKKGES